MDVGIKIREYIEHIGMSQIELSNRTQIPPPKLNRSLSAKRRLTFSEYPVICWALGVGVDKFMEPCPPDGVSN